MTDTNDLNGESSYSRVKEYRSRFEATPSTSFTTRGASLAGSDGFVRHSVISMQPSTSREKEKKRVRALPWRSYLSSLEERSGEQPNRLNLIHDYMKAQNAYRKAKVQNRGKELWADMKHKFGDLDKNWPLVESELLEAEGPGYARTYLMLKDSDRGIICKQRVNGVSDSAPDFTVREVKDPRVGTRLTRNDGLLVPEYEIDDNMIGAPARREVAIIELNDNVKEEYLLSLCRGRGERDVRFLQIYTNPKSQRHLGMALVEFGTTADAFSFIDQYSKTPIMGFPVKVFIDTLGFWILAEYRRLTGLDPERPPRYANLTSNAAIHQIRIAVRKANYRDGIFDNTDTSHFAPRRLPAVHGPHTPAASPPSRDSMELADDNDSQYESRRFNKPKGAHTPVEPAPSTSSNSRISSRVASPVPHTNGRHRSEERRVDSGNSSHRHSRSNSRAYSRHRSRSHSRSSSTSSNTYRRRRRHRRSRTRSRSRSPSYRHGRDHYSYRRHGGGRGFRSRGGRRTFRSALFRDVSPRRNGSGDSRSEFQDRENHYSSNSSSRTSSAIDNHHRHRHESKGSEPKLGEETKTIEVEQKEVKKKTDSQNVANRFVMTMMKQIRRSPQVPPPPVPPAPPTAPVTNGFAADLMLQPPPPPADIKIPSPVETPQPPPPESELLDTPDSHRNHHSDRHHRHNKHHRRFGTPPPRRTPSPPFDVVVQEFMVQEDQLPKMQLLEEERRIAAYQRAATQDFLNDVFSHSYCRRNAQTGEAIFHVPRLYLTDGSGYYTVPVTFVIPEPTAPPMDWRLENVAEACDRIQTDFQFSLFTQATQAINVEMFEELDKLHKEQEEQQRRQMADASRSKEPQRQVFDFEAQFGGGQRSMFSMQPLRMERTAIMTRRIPKKASAVASTSKSKSTTGSKSKRKISDAAQSSAATSAAEDSDEENAEPRTAKPSKRNVVISSDSSSSEEEASKSGSESDAEKSDAGSVSSVKSTTPRAKSLPMERSMSPDTRALVSSDRVVRRVDYNEDNTSDSEQASDWAEDEGVRIEEPRKLKTSLKKRRRSLEADESRKTAKQPPAKKKRRSPKTVSRSSSPGITRPPSAVAAFNFLDAEDFDSASPADATPDGEASNQTLSTPAGESPPVDESPPPVAATTLDEVKLEPPSPTPATIRIPQREATITSVPPVVEAALPIPTAAEPPTTPPISRTERELQLHRQRFCISKNPQTKKEFPRQTAAQQNATLRDVADEEDATYLSIALRRYHIEVERQEATGNAHLLKMRSWNPFKMNPDQLMFALPQKPLKTAKNNRKKSKKTVKSHTDPNLHDLPINREGCARCHVYKKEEKQYDKIVRNVGRIEVTKRDEQMARNRQLKTRELKNLHRGLIANQFQYRQKMLKFARSAIHGWGLFTLEDIAANDMIIEYVGEIVSSIVADVRECNYTKRGMGSSYLFRVNDDKVIDATRKGSVARFINHSCNPNSYAKVVGRQEDRICIYAKRAIGKGEEITYDYKFALEDEKINCYCGADNCRRYLN